MGSLPLIRRARIPDPVESIAGFLAVVTNLRLGEQVPLGEVFAARILYPMARADVPDVRHGPCLRGPFMEPAYLRTVRDKERKNEMNHEESVGMRLFRFLGKVQFTMILLILGGLVMALGTIIESKFGTEAAQGGIYHTFLFDFYLFLIVVNLVVAVINRIPIQRHQWAFVLTHSSIVLLLFGAWVSRTFGHEGTLALREGDTLDRMTLVTADLEVRYGDGEAQRIPLGRIPRPGLLDTARSEHPRLQLLRYEGDAEFAVQLVDAEEEKGPGVKLHLDGKGMHFNEWLIGDHRSFRRKDLGPVEVAILVAHTEKTLADWLPELDSPEVTLRVSLPKGGPAREFRVPADLGKEFELEEGLKIKLVSFLKRARVIDKGIEEDPKAPINPALIFSVQRGDTMETHTVFSQFPEFNLVKGRVGDPLIAGVSLLSPDADEKPLIRILVHPESDRLWVQLAASTGRGAGHPLRQDKTVVLGNLGFEITLLQYVRHAKPDVKLAKAEKKGDGARWIQVLAGPEGDAQEVWISYGSSQSLLVDGKNLVLGFVPAVQPLPFKIQLEKVQADYHPGSSRASQYSSEVKIQGPEGQDRQAVISMNRPLDHAGYRLFQSGFQKARGGAPAVTWLSVSYDPGVTLVYIAFFALILGVGWYVKSNPVQTARKSQHQPTGER